PVFAAWVVSRVISIVTLMVLGARDAPRPDITRLVMWDGGWYQIIAHTGYGTRPIPNVWTPWPFFPLYPGLVRALHTVGAPYSFAQVLIANAAILVALAGVWRLARRHVSTTAATYAVWITALFPGALTFAMGYPDSLFLAASVWAFILLEDRRLVAAGAAALVATAARPNGAVVVVALLVALWSQRRENRVDSDLGRSVAAIAAPSVAFLAIWCAVCWYLTDDPFVFFTAKQAWHEYTLFEWAGHADATLHIVLGLLLVLPFVVRIRRQPPAWIVLVALSILPSMFLGVIGLARYAVQCFPLTIAAGTALERVTPRLGRLALVASAAGLVGFGLLVTQASYVP
ncbi:MAG TPA: glycosyltransferase family 39 protein, partial [Acidimicrobiales bacterium]|nr:glycosyltransferase family 39 protein [Acidimicrobiales bacterium]